ncbi:D-amino-acid oxidase [Zopfochytrium polystomum]|nr:D-amino-acid oxidase [Zopfochytrium polystomum]
MNPQNVTILGAGVQGLSVAFLLLLQGHKVTVVARGSPDDYWPSEHASAKPTPVDPHYTSVRAGANWQSFADPDDIRQQQWDEATFFTLWRLGYHAPCGIMHLPAFQYFSDYPKDFVDPWFHRITPGYAHLPADKLPADRKFGITFETVTVNSPKYVAWLLAQCRARGMHVVHKDLKHIDEAATVAKKTDILINCSGFGARTLGGVMDDKVYPIRGQTVLVRAPQVKRTIGTALATDAYRPNRPAEETSKVTYVIPREDGVVVLGGTYQADNHSLEADPTTSKLILERCIEVCPELVVNGKLPEVIDTPVGLRPGRKGGVRLDSQYCKIGGKEILVIHNYGHGGYGYQSSWGCAASVVRIVRRAVGVPVDDQILTKLLNEVFGSKL